MVLVACAGDSGSRPDRPGRRGGPDAPSASAAAAAALAANPLAASITRTAHGVAHITAPDFETLAYGMAYAYAQDNVCMTAQHLVTVRGERVRTFGAGGSGLVGLRLLPNDVSDMFVTAHMDDAVLARAAAAQSADVQALNRGYVAGYNRYLADNAGHLPPACRNAAWVKPMTAAEYLRIAELSAVQAGMAALADAIVGAAPPKAAASRLPQREEAPIDIEMAAELMREAGVIDPPLGSNAWAFGRDSTRTGAGMLLGNPHFPWAGVNRFWQVHLTVPGQLDVMGVSIGTLPVVVIGFNKDVAWSHTVSTGRRFTLHELTLVAGDPTSYLVDGQPEKMRAREIAIDTGAAAGAGAVAGTARKTQTLWSTRWGPIVSLPRAGLGWTTQRAYALQDANTGNLRGPDTWLAIGRAADVGGLRRALSNLGTPWVNTIAADRQGNALYADASVVPDVDMALLQRCAPSEAAVRLRAGAGIVVLDGSKSDCQWRRDASSPVPGIVPIERLPVAVRADWVHNSNDSYFFTHPGHRFEAVSTMNGDDIIRQPRTRAGLVQVPELVAAGPVTLQGIQRQLFSNRNFVAEQVMPDLVAACDAAPGAAAAPSAEAREGCNVLRQWNRRSDIDARGAHLFREFWRTAMALPKVWRVPMERRNQLLTPTGLNFADAEVAPKLWDALDQAVKRVKAAGFALDAPLGDVLRPALTEEPIALHGGANYEGVLNNLGESGPPGIGPKGIRIDAGTSYVQTVTFDARGPVADALLTYGQSTDPASPHALDQMRLFSRKVWPRLPFHADDVARERVGPVLRVARP
jgi:acyl-homoserine-lactone acylase